MQAMTIEDVLKATGGTLLSGDIHQTFNDVISDSRKVTAGVLFVPLVGEKFDGHEFIKAAFDLGASAVLTQRDTELLVDNTIVKVEDTLKAFGDIAKYYKQKYNVPTVSVTGSVGKTTTKDMLASVLSQKYNTLKTMGNFNNEIGLPITIFGLEKEHEAAVLEMGMNHFGEIEHLADIGRPDVAVITNIGQSHIENLGSREGIFKAKMEMTKLFTKDNTLIVNGDDDFLGALCDTEYRLVKVGAAGGSQVYVYNISDSAENGVEFTLEYKEKATRIHLPVPGRHNAVNAALAIAAGLEAGVSVEEAAKGLQSLEFTDKRLSVKGKNGIKVIDDTYNASPASMKAAIDVLMSAKGLRKVAILGDMFEQGKESPRYHTEVGEYASDKSVDMLIAIGEDAEYIKDGALKSMSAENVKYYKTKNEFLKEMKNIIKSGDVVLVKGSRGMAMDLIVKRIME